jgi:hypothetical protein
MKRLSLLCFSVLVLTNAKGQATISDTAKVYQLIEAANDNQQRGLTDAAERDFRRAGKLAAQLKFDRGLLMYAGYYSAFLYSQVRYEEALEMAQLQLEISSAWETSGEWDMRIITFPFNTRPRGSYAWRQSP